MSPENDQCRWVGIRPTNPKEDIPITLDGEVAHVIVDSGGGGFMPGAPIIVDLNQAVAAINVWYTLLNIAVGAGHVQKIHLAGTGFIYNTQTKITVDGGAAVTYTCTNATIQTWQDLSFNNHYCKEVPIYLIR